MADVLIWFPNRSFATFCLARVAGTSIFNDLLVGRVRAIAWQMTPIVAKATDIIGVVLVLAIPDGVPKKETP